MNGCDRGAPKRRAAGTRLASEERSVNRRRTFHV
jgi:hypothetical protein